MNAESCKSFIRANCHRYIIRGRQLPIARTINKNNRDMLDDVGTQRLRYKIDLDNQHNEGPLLSGPLAMDILFIIVPMGKGVRGEVSYGDPVRIGFPILHLIRFVEDLLIGTIYPTADTVVTIQAEKIYGPQAITEITLKKI